jgi:hypothetical protein
MIARLPEIVAAVLVLVGQYLGSTTATGALLFALGCGIAAFVTWRANLPMFAFLNSASVLIALFTLASLYGR